MLYAVSAAAAKTLKVVGEDLCLRLLQGLFHDSFFLGLMADDPPGFTAAVPDSIPLGMAEFCQTGVYFFHRFGTL